MSPAAGAASRAGKYELGSTLGHGPLGEVRLGRDTETGRHVAVKVVDRSRIGVHILEQIKAELKVAKAAQHPHAPQLLEVLSTPSTVFSVVELVPGGELFQRIVLKGRVGEEESRRFFQQLIHALAFCHAQGLFHGDLRVESLLLDASGQLKVSGFGWSALRGALGADGLPLTCCPFYLAPELLDREAPSDPSSSDLWSTGVILFLLVAGFLPFDHADTNSLHQKIRSADYTCPPWFSPGVVDLLSHILDPNPSTRFGVDQIRQHEWVNKGGYCLATPSPPASAPPSTDDIDAAFATTFLADGAAGGFSGTRDEVDGESKEKAEKRGCGAGVDKARVGLELGEMAESDSALAVSLGSEGRQAMVQVRRWARFASRVGSEVVRGSVERAALALGFSCSWDHTFKMSCEGGGPGPLKALSLSVQIFQLSPGLLLVDLFKTSGGILEFYKFFKSFCSRLDGIVWKTGVQLDAAELAINTDSAQHPPWPTSVHPALSPRRLPHPPAKALSQPSSPQHPLGKKLGRAVSDMSRGGGAHMGSTGSTSPQQTTPPPEQLHRSVLSRTKTPPAPRPPRVEASPERRSPMRRRGTAAESGVESGSEATLDGGTRGSLAGLDSLRIMPPPHSNALLIQATAAAFLSAAASPLSAGSSPLASPRPLVSPCSLVSDGSMFDDAGEPMSPLPLPRPAPSLPRDEPTKLRASSSFRVASSLRNGHPPGTGDVLDYCSLANDTPGVRRAFSGRLSPKPPVEPLRLGPLVSALAENNVAQIREAAGSIRLALKGCVENKQRLIQAGGIHSLVQLLRSPDPLTVEHGVTALFNICRVEAVSHDIAAVGGLEALVGTLHAESSTARENAAAAIFCLSDSVEHRAALCDAGALPGLTNILKTGSVRGKKDAALAIFNLLKRTGRTSDFVSTGGVSVLLDLLQNSDNGLEEKAIAVLAFVAKSEEGREAILRAHGLVPIVDALELPGERAREDAVSTLLHVCSSNADALRTISEEGVIPSLHKMCQIGSERARQRAQSLLRLLRGPSQSGPLSSVAPIDRQS